MNGPTQQVPSGASDAHDPAVGVPGVCRDAHARASLVPYACASCDDEEALRFEAHLLTCSACFEDLKLLDRVGHILKEFTDKNPGGLKRLLELRKKS
ncbi:MAG: zf-HC2 domain-containing protein [Planctomycetota bacterium]|nr:zf-HC2 domain-containing protein [Planctomycetota bacterium]